MRKRKDYAPGVKDFAVYRFAVEREFRKFHSRLYYYAVVERSTGEVLKSNYDRPEQAVNAAGIAQYFHDLP